MPALASNSLHTPSIANKTECLVTNGTGSFASLAINGGLSRKFHGLLVHSTRPPMDRLLTWHHCSETLAGQCLDARQWLNGTDIQRANGEMFLISYSSTPMPTWDYQVNGNLLRKELFMVPGQATTILRYTLLASPATSTTLTLQNSVHFRSAEAHRDRLHPSDIESWIVDAKRQSIRYDATELKLGLQTDSEHKDWNADWLQPNVINQTRDLVYPIELEDQGFDQRDSSLRVHEAIVDLTVGNSVYMIGTLEQSWPNASAEYQKAVTARQRAFFADDFANDLAHSALQLIADRDSVNGKTLLAGFPWFGDWGRDTMIALPGTTLVTGQYDTARSILKTFAHYLSGGMLPNKFPDRDGEPLKYNTIDATLWYFWAIQQYVKHTSDWSFVKTELYQDLQEIIRHHEQGTRYGIGMDDDGLIQGGDKDTQLTWMDVKFDGFAVTPRYGKAVEINALWYNALGFLADCAEQFRDDARHWRSRCEQVRTSFQKTFWNEELQCCYDYVADGTAHDDIRCNQIIAVALPYSPLSEKQQHAVFNIVYRQLYTPVGLRSLSPTHSDYKSHYYGALHTRDLAYHQGTVWAWPMGPFIDAAMKTQNDKNFAANLLRGMKQHFYSEAGIHGISEVFDGDAPHAARGCFNQAWSVAETLRVIAQYDLKVPG